MKFREHSDSGSIRPVGRIGRKARGLIVLGLLGGCVITGGTPTLRIAGNAADPAVFEVGGTTYAVTTQPPQAGPFPQARIPLYKSSNGIGGPWNFVHDALSGQPAWAENHDYWAPDLSAYWDGQAVQFVLLHTANRTGDDPGSSCPTANQNRCIGIARTTDLAQQFTANVNPLICSHGCGGAIDASVLRHGGKTYVYYSEGGPPSRIRVLEVRNDFTHKPGNNEWTEGTLLLTGQPRHPENDVAENPSMVVRNFGGTEIFYLFYSMSDWRAASYATNFAYCTGPKGPCWRQHENPDGVLTAANTGLHGPGGSSFRGLAGGDVLVFHAGPQANRQMYSKSVGFIDPSVIRGAFVDDDGRTLEPFIDDLAAQGIVSGCRGGPRPEFCPTHTMTRGEFAAMLVRALNLPSTSTNYFDDDNGTWYETYANSLAAAGITTGCAPRTFCGGDATTRGMAAAFIDRGFGLPGTGTDFFTDDTGTFYEGAANRMAASGVTTGCSPTLFCGSDPMTREQGAAFVSRGLDL